MHLITSFAHQRCMRNASRSVHRVQLPNTALVRSISLLRLHTNGNGTQCKLFYVRCPFAQCKPICNPSHYFFGTPTVNAQCSHFGVPCPIAQCKPASVPSHYFSGTPTVNAQCKPFCVPCPIKQCKPISDASHYFSCTPRCIRMQTVRCTMSSCTMQAHLISISLFLLHINCECAIRAVHCTVSN